MLNVIVDDTRDPLRNLALDEALARTGDGASGPSPMLRVWQTVPSVLLGRFQDAASTVDLDACARDGIQVARRATGGGAVFTDSGTLCFTLVHHRADRPRSAGFRHPRGTRPDLDALVVTAVEEFGLPAAALRDGTVVQAARLRTRRATLTQVAVHVSLTPPHDRTYIVPTGVSESARGGTRPWRRTLADFEPEVTQDAVRAAVLSVVVEEYGTTCTRRPSAAEQSARERLYAARYGDLTWHLAGSGGRRGGGSGLPDDGGAGLG